MATATVIVKGTSFLTEYDHSPEDRSTGCHESVELCSVCQTGAQDGEDILCFLTEECTGLIEEALIEHCATSQAERKAEHADILRDQRQDERRAA